MEVVEYAPEYTKTERIRITLFAALAGTAVVLVSRLWFFPWLREFSQAAPCRSLFGVNGAVVLFYGIFVGLPLLVAIVIGASTGRRGYKILREGRVPPSGEKVFRSTPVRRGARAKLSGYFQLLSVVPLLALTLWGVAQAQSLAARTTLKPLTCEPISAIENTR